MKKILLSLFLLSTWAVLDAQTVLNETYGNPGSGKHQFIELYNSSTVGIQNVNCYTLLTYWDNGFAKNNSAYRNGWYVLDFSDTSVGPKQWFVLAAANPFNVQSLVGVSAEINWNALSFRNGSTGGYLKKFAASGGTYVDSLLPDSRIIDNLFPLGDFATGQNRLLLLFQNGTFINGLWAGGPTGTLPASITGMPNLTVTPSPGSCTGSGTFVVNFATLGAVEFVNESAGADNGYARKFDGKCGSWDKTAPGLSHTPHLSNGTATGETGLLTTAQSITCATGATFPNAKANFDITSITAPVTEASDFPVEVQLYRDVNNDGILDGGDTLVAPVQFINTVAAAGQSVDFIAANSGSEELLFVYKTKRGCFDKVVRIVQACASLPVNLKSFTAVRDRSNVSLKWETVTEENNLGFEIQRMIGVGQWQKVAFVNSQANAGNSSSLLTYEFNDYNPTKGITQYRLKQMDIDGKSAYSNIRSVRGDGQKGKTIVYPNPSNDGKVNVVFEDVNVIRDISLIDMNGRTIKQWKGISNNTIQMDNLVPGFYTVRIVNTETGEQDVEKIIVNKR